MMIRWLLGCVAMISMVAAEAPAAAPGLPSAKNGSGSISGTITNADTAAPLEGVRVYVIDANRGFGGDALSDGVGAYSITGLADGTYFARTTNSLGLVDGLHGGGACLNCQMFAGAPIVVSGGAAVSGIDFALEAGASISGQVVDAGSQAAIAGTRVEVLDEDGFHLLLIDVQGDGSYTSSTVLPAGSYFVATRTPPASGYLDQVFSGADCGPPCDIGDGTAIVLAAREARTGIDFELETGGSVSGTVREQGSSDPIQAVSIVIYDANGVFATSASSGADGSYTSRRGLSAGSYFAHTFNSQQFINQSYDGIDCLPVCDPTSGTPIVVGAGQAVPGVDFNLTKGGSISGTVTDAGSAASLPFLNVKVYDASGELAVQAVTSFTDGTFITGAGLPAGTYYARTSNFAGYMDELYLEQDCPGCDVTSGTAIPVAAGAESPNVDFTLASGASVSGTVSEAGTGERIYTGFVDLFNAGGGFVDSSLLNGLGEYIVFSTVPDGTYFARTDVAGYVDRLYGGIDCPGDCDVTVGTPIVIAGGVPATGIDFQLVPELIFEDGFETGDESEWSTVVN